MEHSTDNSSWGDNYNDTTSTGIQTAHPDFNFWDPMIFSEPGTLNGGQDSQPLSNPSVDSIITTPQSVPNVSTSNQELSYDLGSETISPNQLAVQRYTIGHEGLNEDIQKEVKELRDLLQVVKMELVTLKGEMQMAHSELYTIQSNHRQLLQWTLDMGETVKKLLSWLAERIGANIVGQEGFHIEDLGSWLNPGSEG